MGRMDKPKRTRKPPLAFQLGNVAVRYIPLSHPKTQGDVAYIPLSHPKILVSLKTPGNVVVRYPKTIVSLPPLPKICLMTGFYTDIFLNRNLELEKCRAMNVANSMIDKIVLFLEDCDEAKARSLSPAANSTKIEFVPMGRRMRFCDFFEKANKDFAEWVVIVANADVYLDETLAKVFSHDLNREVLCLSRTEYPSSEVEVNGFSQDCWIFRSPLRRVRSDWYLGLPRCDNVLSYKLKQIGYELKNPCRSIRVWHVHNSCIRHYTKKDKIKGKCFCVKQT